VVGNLRIMPSEVAIYRPHEWSSWREHSDAVCKWYRKHGVDPADAQEALPILQASKRVHARTPAELPSLDRAWLKGDPVGWAEARLIDRFRS
jgi:hypothetical protein